MIVVLVALDISKVVIRRGIIQIVSQYPVHWRIFGIYLACIFILDYFFAFMNLMLNIGEESARLSTAIFDFDRRCLSGLWIRSLRIHSGKEINFENIREMF